MKQWQVITSKFMNAVDIVQGQWGKSHPERLAKEDEDHGDRNEHQEVDKCNEKFSACLFMDRANKKLHKNQTTCI